MAWYREEDGVVISDEQFKEVCCNCYGHCAEGCISVPCRGDELSCPYYDVADTDKYEKEIRAKAIEEFAERIKHEIENCSWQFSRLEAETIDEIAEQLKGE